MTFESSNKEEFENLPTKEIVKLISNGLQAGCVSLAHLFDAIDEALCRLAKHEGFKYEPSYK